MATRTLAKQDNGFGMVWSRRSTHRYTLNLSIRSFRISSGHRQRRVIKNQMWILYLSMDWMVNGIQRGRKAMYYGREICLRKIFQPQESWQSVGPFPWDWWQNWIIWTVGLRRKNNAIFWSCWSRIDTWSCQRIEQRSSPGTCRSTSDFQTSDILCTQSRRTCSQKCRNPLTHLSVKT